MRGGQPPYFPAPRQHARAARALHARSHLPGPHLPDGHGSYGFRCFHCSAEIELIIQLGYHIC